MQTPMTELEKKELIFKLYFLRSLEFANFLYIIWKIPQQSSKEKTYRAKKSNKITEVGR